jgi:hypothetical protein
MISFYAFRKSKQKDTALSSSNIVIYNQTIRTTKNTPNNSSTGIMPHLAKALCLLLLLLSILLVYMASPINVVIAKDCTDEGRPVVMDPHRRVILKTQIPSLVLHLVMMAMENIFH